MDFPRSHRTRRLKRFFLMYVFCNIKCCLEYAFRKVAFTTTTV